MFIKRIAVIPARSGSKRLEGKNSRLFCGMTLVEITARCALTSGIFDKIIITSDDASHRKNEAISDLIKFHLRPPELSTDDATSVDVIKYICNQFNFQKEDLICLLQPTSPLRLPSDIQESTGNSTVSVCVKSHGNNCLRHSVSEVFTKYNISHNFHEDVNVAEADLYFNGAVYWMSVEELFFQNLLVSDKTKLFFMPEYRSIDIDYEKEFILAESRFKLLGLPDLLNKAI